jgi:transposase
MGKPLSMDLRSRVIASIDAGMSRRAAAARYGVAPSTAIRWDSERRTTGSFAPKLQGGDMRSKKIEANAGVIHAALEETPDLTLSELCRHLAQRRGLDLVAVALFPAARDHVEKKTGHAVEQDRPDVLKQRQDWFDGQFDLDPERLVFIDET